MHGRITHRLASGNRIVDDGATGVNVAPRPAPAATPGEGNVVEVANHLPVANFWSRVSTILIWNIDIYLREGVLELLSRILRPSLMSQVLQCRRVCQPNRRVRFEVDVPNQEARRIFRKLHAIRHQYNWLVKVKEVGGRHRMPMGARTRPPATPGKQTMTLVSYNVNGIKQKREDIRLYMQSLDADVFALQETLRQPDLFRLHFYGYQCIERTMVPGPGKRGLAIAVKQCFSAYQVGVGSDYWIFIRIVGGQLKSPIIVGNVYMPHRNVAVPHLRRESRNNLQAEVASLSRRYPNDPIIVMGDFNRRTEAMVKLLRGMPGLCEPKVIGDPGTLRKAHGGQLDHVLVSTIHSASMHNVYVDQSVDLSDHWPIIASLALLSGRATDNEVSKPIWRLPKTVTRKQEWCEFLKCHNYWDVLADEVNNEEDPVEDRVLDVDERILPTGPATALKHDQMNTLATNFVDTCNRIGTSAKVRIERPQTQRVSHPTSKAHVRAAKKQRQLYVAYKCARRTGNLQRMEEASRAYKVQRKLTKQLAKKAKTDRWYQAIRDAEENKKKDPRQLWKWCAELGGWNRKRQTQKLQPMCDKNGVLQTDAVRVGEVWYEHYAHLAADLTGHSQNSGYWDTVLHPTIDSSTVPILPGLNEDLTAAEIKETMVFLRNNKARALTGSRVKSLRVSWGRLRNQRAFGFWYAS